MSLFFLTFFAVYGGVHVYAFLKARNALGLEWRSGIFVAAFMLLMTAAPMLIRLLERMEWELSARLLAYLGYLWMAVLFLFFCGSLAVDLITLLTKVGGLIAKKDLSALSLPARPVFFALLGLSALLCVYGFFDARNIRLERMTLETDKLPPGVDRLAIAQISDVHLGLIVRCDQLDRILAVVRRAQPDLLVSTGDLVDAQINHLPGLAERLREIQPRYGKFAITGNHEYYAGLGKALSFTRDAGFTLLRGEAKDIGVIAIGGVDDPTGAQLGIDQPVNERELFSRFGPAKFRLLLKHRPTIDRSSEGAFDLQLSGHTHKGQIWPFTYLSMISYPLNAGQYDLPGGAILRVSRGTGTWGPPIRVLSPPEVTVIELIRKKY